MKNLKSSIKGKPKGKLQILAIFDHLRDVYRQDHFKGSPANNILAEIPIDNKSIREEVANHKARLQEFIKELVEKNSYTKQPEKLANKLYLLYEGALSESYAQKDSWPIKEAKEIALTLI